VNGERQRAAGIERGMGCVSLNERESEWRDVEEKVSHQWNKNASTICCVLSSALELSVRDIYYQSACDCFFSCRLNQLV
jgi:hypothetical protein